MFETREVRTWIFILEGKFPRLGNINIQKFLTYSWSIPRRANLFKHSTIISKKLPHILVLQSDCIIIVVLIWMDHEVWNETSRCSNIYELGCTYTYITDRKFGSRESFWKLYKFLEFSSISNKMSDLFARQRLTYRSKEQLWKHVRITSNSSSFDYLENHVEWMSMVSNIYRKRVLSKKKKKRHVIFKKSLTTILPNFASTVYNRTCNLRIKKRGWKKRNDRDKYARFVT